jgi:hypothetical protein
MSGLAVAAGSVGHSYERSGISAPPSGNSDWLLLNPFTDLKKGLIRINPAVGAAVAKGKVRINARRSAVFLKVPATPGKNPERDWRRVLPRLRTPCAALYFVQM